MVDCFGPTPDAESFGIELQHVEAIRDTGPGALEHHSYHYRNFRLTSLAGSTRISRAIISQEFRTHCSIDFQKTA
jgi:hypothetical protein